MMTSLAQAYSPHPGGIHPGVPQSHPMAVPHNPGQQGQPGMPQQMHMGVSGPGGPQVSQAGAMMGGMPPGAGGPSAHALQHLNPQAAQQQQLLQQQQAMAFTNTPQFQMQQQQQHIMQQQQRAQQVARQAMISSQYTGMGQAIPGQLTPAQYQAMRGANPSMARPVHLSQHLQAQQAGLQGHHTLEQQQAQAQQQQQHQQLLAQQVAMQQANAQAQVGSNQGQPNPMNAQQIQMQQAHMAHASQAAQQQQQNAAAAQQNQPPQSQPPNQPQPPQPNSQNQSQQPQPPQPGMQQQAAQSAMMAARQQAQQQGEKPRGRFLLKLIQFAAHLSNFEGNSKPLQSDMVNGTQRLAGQGTKQRDDLGYWSDFAELYFSTKGVLRHSVWIVDETSNKQYEITFPALARYFHTHFESGIKNMQLVVDGSTENDLPNGGCYIECRKSRFQYLFDNGCQLFATGTLRAHFDAAHKIELLEFVTSNHEEFLPRTKIIEAARPLHEWGKEWHKINTPPEGKQSPELNKKKSKPMKSPPQPPPDIDLPASKVKLNMGITPSVFRFLELAEVVGQMNPLFGYAHQHPNLPPYGALEQYVSSIPTANGNNPGQPKPAGPRTPSLQNFPVTASPAAAHLNLPGGSPHIGGSPAQAPPMQLQQSQHGTSSSGPSANTSPNTSNKRRRPSAVKTEDDGQVNGIPTKTGVRPSPRIPKKQRPNPPGQG